MTPRPGVSLLELLIEQAGRAGRGAAVDENLAESLEQSAVTLRIVADALERLARRAKGEAAQHAADEELLTEAVRRLQPAREHAIAAVSARAPHRPRLEDSDDQDDRDRAAAVQALLERDPSMSDYKIGLQCGVHHEVVARLRKVLRKVPDPQEVRGKGSDPEGPP